MAATDNIVPFAFEQLPVRGALVQLETTWQRMQSVHDYEANIAEVLGHAAAATALIAQSLKFDGQITLQINSDGPLGMLIMQSTDTLDLRGMAVASGVKGDESFSALVAGARCAVTVDAGEMEQPYQGIVEMNPDSLAASLENYFARSVQLPSHIQLRSDGKRCGGVLLQQMPERNAIQEDDWRRLSLMIETLRCEELAQGATPDLLHKLFAEDDVRVYQPRDLQFLCRCTKAKVEDVLRFLGESETRTACEERGLVEVTCEYCGRVRRFDAVDVTRIFAGQVVDGSDALH